MPKLTLLVISYDLIGFIIKVDVPIVSDSNYLSPPLFANGYVQSILPHLFRRVKAVHYERERIVVPEADFLDLDWSRVGARRLAILTHGLEGSTSSSYMLGMTRALNSAGWDVLAWNMRGCSGELNNMPRMYHAGQTKDLKSVFSHALFKKSYEEIVLIGFSLGGNIVLKFLGEIGEDLSSLVSKCITFSVPCDLQGSAMRMMEKRNWVFHKHFVKRIVRKLLEKKKRFPAELRYVEPKQLKTIRDIDNDFVAPLNGFKSAEEYWRRCSCKPFLKEIKVPTLIVSAEDDPLLSESCYPTEIAAEHPNIFLEVTSKGGHSGFIQRNEDGSYWSEERALSFLTAHPS